MLNAVENKFDTGDLFTNGETTETKLPGDFKVIIPKNPLLSITSGYKYKESYQTLWSILSLQLAIPSHLKTARKLSYILSSMHS